MSPVASMLFFLAVIGGSLTTAILGLRFGVHEALLVPLITVVASIAILLAQRWRPFAADWRDYADALRVDSLHALISTAGAAKLVELALLGWLVSVSDSLAAWVGFSPWPVAWPLVAQLVLALVIAEFGAYWMHRLGHIFPFFWRFHALHHSSDRLYGLNSARNHPINVTYALLASLIPLVMLGTPPEVLLILTVFTSVHGVLQHSNLDVHMGPLNWVFTGPELHRRHHHIEEARSNSNFGSTLVLWDLVFGTRALPADEVNDQVGLPDMAFSTNFWTHLASPFRLNRLARVVEATERAVEATERAAVDAGRRVLEVTNELTDLATDARPMELSASGHYIIRRD